MTIKCVDCGSEFELPRELIDPTVRVMEHRNRMLLLTIPNDCPECHNLHVAKGGE